MNFSDLSVQKSEVKRGLRAELILKAVWEPIAMEWLQKWKLYVDFDSDGLDTRSKEVHKLSHDIFFLSNDDFHWNT
jgi:hypothetical protein